MIKYIQAPFKQIQYFPNRMLVYLYPQVAAILIWYGPAGEGPYGGKS